MLLALLTAVLLTACSKEREGTPDDNQSADILSRFDAEGKAWLCLDINLPASSNATRTSFADGDDADFAVNSLTVVLLHGSSEADAKVASSASMSFAGPTPSTEPQITNTIQVSSNNIEQGDNVYMLVLLNTTYSPPVDKKLSELQLSDIGNTTGGFVMSNALTSTKPGGSSDPAGTTLSTLTQLASYHFWATATEAEANPLQVFVERLAAKVTTTLKSGVTSVNGNSTITFVASDMTWALDNYNTSSFATRQFESSWVSYNASSKGYRMIEQTPLLTLGNLYRTYWTKDVNYDDGVTANFTNSTNATPSWKSMTASDYCAENTMDVARMTDENTTSVLVRLQLNGGNVFYTTSVTGSDVIFQEPSTTIEEEGTSASSSFARRKSNFVTPDATNYPKGITIDSYLRQWLMQFEEVRTWVNTYAGGRPEYIRFKLATADVGKAGSVTFKASQEATSSTAGTTAWTTLDVATKLSGITVTQYPEGFCYYRVPIKHFGDELTPWISASTMDKKNTSLVYPGDATARNNAYLGRYGVVRNNWYNINIVSVSHVGSAVIPPLTNYADDVVEQALNAKVVISKWEVHNQEMKF